MPICYTLYTHKVPRRLTKQLVIKLVMPTGTEVGNKQTNLNGAGGADDPPGAGGPDEPLCQ